MATIIFNNKFTTGVYPNTTDYYTQYSTNSGSNWSSDDTTNANSTVTSSSLWIRAHTSGSTTYVTFTLCFNMGSQTATGETEKGASVDVVFDSSKNPYCKLSNFSDKKFWVTIKE